MLTLRTQAEDRRWQELLDEIDFQLATLKNSDDRIRQVWALRIIAESLTSLDLLDRQQGFLPLQLRLPLMLRPREAAAILKAFASVEASDGQIRLRIEEYLEGRVNEYSG